MTLPEYFGKQEDLMNRSLIQIARGSTIVEASVNNAIPLATLTERCNKLNMEEQTSGTMHVWVPTNRYDRDYRKASMDGWNEILNAYKRDRYHGGSRELENVEHVASYVAEQMAKDAWKPMRQKENSVPCSVTILFVERNRKRDIPNVFGGSKYAIDALTHRHKCGASAIFDDSPHWLQCVAYGRDVDPEEPGMHIVIRELRPRE